MRTLIQLAVKGAREGMEGGGGGEGDALSPDIVATSLRFSSEMISSCDTYYYCYSFFARYQPGDSHAFHSRLNNGYLTGRRGEKAPLASLLTDGSHRFH